MTESSPLDHRSSRESLGDVDVEEAGRDEREKVRRVVNRTEAGFQDLRRGLVVSDSDRDLSRVGVEDGVGGEDCVVDVASKIVSLVGDDVGSEVGGRVFGGLKNVGNPSVLGSTIAEDIDGVKVSSLASRREER